jgi:hypothetical protein
MSIDIAAVMKSTQTIYANMLDAELLFSFSRRTGLNRLKEGYSFMRNIYSCRNGALSTRKEILRNEKHGKDKRWGNRVFQIGSAILASVTAENQEVVFLMVGIGKFRDFENNNDGEESREKKACKR